MNVKYTLLIALVSIFACSNISVAFRGEDSSALQQPKKKYYPPLTRSQPADETLWPLGLQDAKLPKNMRAEHRVAPKIPERQVIPAQ